MLQFTKDDVMYVIELGVMMLLSLVVMFMVVRPLVRRVLASEVIPALTGEGSSVPALTDGSAEAAGGQSLVPAGLNMVDVAQVQGQVHAQTVHRVGELAERNPNETANIVRQWLSEPAA
jgi:flagellar M-ring protein FliF